MEGSIIKDPKVPNSTVPANFCCGWPKVLIWIVKNLTSFNDQNKKVESSAEIYRDQSLV